MSKGKFAIGALFGAVSGFVTGILLAPKSGKETRSDLKGAAASAKDVVVDNAGQIKETAERKAKEAKAWGEEVVDEVTDKATELKGRAENALEGAKKGFSTKPTDKKK